MAAASPRAPVTAPSADGDGTRLGAARQRSGFDWLWTAGKVLFGLVLVTGSALLVGYGAWNFAVTSERFALRHVSVQGSVRFSETALLNLSGIKPKDNLFALDLQAAEQRLLENPWIASVSLVRKLPSTLAVEIREHRPEALAMLADTLYLVTREGHPITPLSPDEPADYPVVSGVTAEELVTDRQRGEERIAQALELLRRYERMPLARVYPAQEVHVTPDGTTRLIVGANGTTLELGSGPVGQKLLMAARVMNQVRAKGQTPSIVFLDNVAHPERVVVRLR